MFRWGNRTSHLVGWNPTSHLVGWKTHPTIIITPVGDRTHDLPHTVASNMVNVSHALNHSATASVKMQSNETWKSTGLRASEVMYSPTWSRKIISHTGNPNSSRPTWREHQGENTKKNNQLQGPCLTSGIGVPSRRFIYNILTYRYDGSIQ